MKQEKAQHTPGPWFRMDMRYTGQERVCIEIATFSDDGNPEQHIARVNHCDINPTREVCETVAANARLIAAAPLLLEALQELLEASLSRDMTLLYEARANAREAIAATQP